MSEWAVRAADWAWFKWTTVTQRERGHTHTLTLASSISPDRVQSSIHPSRAKPLSSLVLPRSRDLSIGSPNKLLIESCRRGHPITVDSGVLPLNPSGPVPWAFFIRIDGREISLGSKRICCATYGQSAPLTTPIPSIWRTDEEVGARQAKHRHRHLKSRPGVCVRSDENRLTGGATVQSNWTCCYLAECQAWWRPRERERERERQAGIERNRKTESDWRNMDMKIESEAGRGGERDDLSAFVFIESRRLRDGEEWLVLSFYFHTATHKHFSQLQ